ncbi:MAG: NAD(P)-binding domain-containing protein, partial [Alicyclobacillus sp.]|nr:NAD(P)-binding domain-containing protein [Alicyclobacillus sp.]
MALTPGNAEIGFIGTGVMGSGMVRNLMRKGYRVTVYNRTRSKAEALLAEGARWADSPGQLAAACDAVLTIVGYPQDVEQVYLGP